MRPHRSTDGSLARHWLDGYNVEGTFYSTDIAAAWEVVEKLSALGYAINLDTGDGFTVASFYQRSAPYAYNELENAVHGSANVAPLAICRAALKAVESGAKG